MSAGRPNPITRNLQVAYDDVVSVSVPEGLAELLDEIDGSGPARRRKRDDDLDGISAENPQRPRGGPKSNGAAETVRNIPRD